MPVLVITGGSRGIGRAVALAAAEGGHDIAFTFARDAGAAADVKAAVEAKGRHCLALQVDADDAAATDDFFSAVVAAWGGVDGVVVNAGLTGAGSPLAEADPATIRRVIDVNVTGALLTCRAAARTMATDRGGRGGSIVLLSSAAATLGAPGEFVWYAASKGAMDTLTIGLAKELGPAGIRVNAVSPGLIATEIHTQSGRGDRLARLLPQVPMGRIGEADEVAGPILFLLSPAASYVSGAILRIGGGR